MSAPRNPSRAWEAVIIASAGAMAWFALAVADLAAQVLR